MSWAAIHRAAVTAAKVPPTYKVPFEPLQDAEVCDQSSFGKVRPWISEDWSKASAWFRSHVQVYVLNLPSDYRRWEDIKSRLGQLNIKAIRVAGLDLRKAGVWQEGRDGGFIPQGFNLSHYSRSFGDDLARDARGAEGLRNVLRTLGHAAAHIKVLRQILDDRPSLAVVLEDDSWLEDDFVPRLWNLVSEELPCDWEVVSLSSRCGYGRCISQHLARVQVDGNEPAFTCREGVNLGMYGMLYRVERLGDVLAKWQGVLFDEDRPHCLKADVALAALADQVAYYVVPSSQAPGFLHESHLLGSSSRAPIKEADV